MAKLIRLVLLLILAGTAYAQELPDAPQPQTKCQQTVIDENNDIAYKEIFCDSIPEWRELPKAQKHVSYFATRHYEDPPLRTNSETFHSKSFIIPEITMYGTVTADVIVNRNSPTAPKGIDLFVDAYVPALTASGFDYVMHRYIFAPTGNGIVGYVIYKHARGLKTGIYP
jgi:hypothetical protein